MYFLFWNETYIVELFKVPLNRTKKNIYIPISILNELYDYVTPDQNIVRYVAISSTQQ